MKKVLGIILLIFIILFGAGCVRDNATKKESRIVEAQQRQLGISQPVPVFDWSLERHLMIELYKLRNQKVATHAVWRSDYGLIEYDCPSLGYGLPYDVSLTNPLTAKNFAIRHGYDRHVVEQPEPNGIFASKNTSATWVMCVGDVGMLEPVYIESKVTIFPYPVKVDYDKNRVTKVGKATVTIKQ